MFIQTEETPNPASLKFIPGVDVMTNGTAEFRSPSAAGNSPLAQNIFAVDGVAAVFLGGDFITVTKGEGKDWEALRPAILGTIAEHFESNRPVIAAAEQKSGCACGNGGCCGGKSKTGEEDEAVRQIKELLETRVRPALAQDGGDVAFHSFEDGIVYLRLKGACSGCPSATMTLKSGIENLLKHFVPEVLEVRAVR